MKRMIHEPPVRDGSDDAIKARRALCGQTAGKLTDASSSKKDREGIDRHVRNQPHGRLLKRSNFTNGCAKSDECVRELAIIMARFPLEGNEWARRPTEEIAGKMLRGNAALA
jgi:hypothetical protein